MMTDVPIIKNENKDLKLMKGEEINKIEEISDKDYWTKEFRRRREQTFKNKGVNARQYRRSVPSVVNRFPLGMDENPSCTKFLGVVLEEKYVLRLFKNIEPTLLREIPEKIDWKDENGVKYKHIASSIRIRPWQLGGNDYFAWYVNYNSDPDYFILSGWGINFEPLFLLKIHKDEVIRDRKFWRRDMFSVVNIQKGLREFEKYMMKDKLKELKDLVRDDPPL